MNLKPLGDKIVLKMVKDETENVTRSGIVLPSSSKEQPSLAEVVAVGEGITQDEKKKDTVKVGDRVIYSKYAGTEVKLQDENYIIVKHPDVLCVVED